jgi:hypothetical protein
VFPQLPLTRPTCCFLASEVLRTVKVVVSSSSEEAIILYNDEEDDTNADESGKLD